MRGGLLGLWILVAIGSLVVVIIAAVDASRHPDWAWQRAGSSKALWIALPIVLLLLCGFVGGILGVVYLLSIKPKVVAAEQQGPPPGWGGTGGWGPQPPPPTWSQPPPPPPTWGQPPPPPPPNWGDPPPPPES
ncbi:MAG: hypothetical protein JOZ99_13185 [Actinobacteria bacterium]|nr:hypothetical protein [Actinomycetota bacterium]